MRREGVRNRLHSPRQYHLDNRIGVPSFARGIIVCQSFAWVLGEPDAHLANRFAFPLASNALLSDAILVLFESMNLKSTDFNVLLSIRKKNCSALSLVLVQVSRNSSRAGRVSNASGFFQDFIYPRSKLTSFPNRFMSGRSSTREAYIVRRSSHSKPDSASTFSSICMDVIESSLKVGLLNARKSFDALQASIFNFFKLFRGLQKPNDRMVVDRKSDSNSVQDSRGSRESNFPDRVTSFNCFRSSMKEMSSFLSGPSVNVSSWPMREI